MNIKLCKFWLSFAVTTNNPLPLTTNSRCGEAQRRLYSSSFFFFMYSISGDGVGWQQQSRSLHNLCFLSVPEGGSDTSRKEKKADFVQSHSV